MSVTVAILAGGLATRLGPLTAKTPKALLDVAGRPFLEQQLLLLAQNQIQDVVLCLGHQAEQVQHVIEDGSRLGMRVRYSFDGPRPLGTGGALVQALPQLSEPFLVLYGDSFLECDYQAVVQALKASKHPALMTVYRNKGQFDRSNVELANGQVTRYDKKNPSGAMEFIDYGLGAFTKSAFEGRQTGAPFDLADVYRALAEQGRLAGYEVMNRFYEIGSVEGLAETRRHLEQKGKS